ncbi:MAG TPA: hypothetical protein VKR24_01175 [Candidatus Limnocylindrales bacterium]|nr:hypothetical protein [Candidatus Limnocylindrales bacterium]
MSRLVYSLRPLSAWPYPATPYQDQRHRPFSTPWTQTQNQLADEIEKLDGSSIVLGLGHTEWDVRQDGQLRANAKPLSHQGVEISFTTPRGRLTYATDVCDFWQDNVRSIALGLEALRAVDRYGITRKGEQYAGFAQLAAGGPDPERGRILVERAGSLREAQRRHHPDNGGLEADFVDVIAFRDQQARIAS